MSKARKFEKNRHNGSGNYIHPKGEPIKTNETLLRAWLGGSYDFPFKPHQHFNKLPRTFLRPDETSPHILTYDNMPIAEHLPNDSLLIYANKENAVYYIHRQLIALLEEYGWHEVDYEEPDEDKSIKELFGEHEPTRPELNHADVEIEDTLKDIFG